MERQQIVRAASNSPALPGVALPLQENLFPQVSGAQPQSPSATYSNRGRDRNSRGRDLPDISLTSPAKHQGNAQSEAANVRVHPSKSELKTNILNFIRERVGSTTEEVATGLNLRYTTASGRISELRRDSALEDSGKTRPTSSGCAATVWTTKGTTK
jgi:hypothetical protein